MESTLTRLLAALFDIPDWAPRALRRSAVLTLAATALLLPTVFRDATTLWLNHYEQAVMHKMQPILDSLLEQTTPAPGPRQVRKPHGCPSRQTSRHQCRQSSNERSHREGQEHSARRSANPS